MWQIIWRELKDRKWSLFAYCIGSLTLLWLYVATFLSSQNSTQALQELVKSYPKGLLDALGLSNLNINTIEIYLNAKHFSFLWPLLAIILVMSRAGNQIAGEIQSGTMGLLLSTPLSRTKIFAGKYMTGLVTIVVFCAVSLYGVIPLAAAYDIPTHPQTLNNAFLLCVIFSLAIYSFTLAVSSWLSETSKVYGIVGAVLVAAYAANIVALIVDKYSWLKYWSAFYYFDTQDVLAGNPIMHRTLIVFAAVIVVCTATAIWRFHARDMSV